MASLKFVDGNGSYSFSDFYPHVDLSGVQKAIVVTQTCDLEHRKLPYITIGLLEPFTKNRAVGNFFTDPQIGALIPVYNEYAFYNPTAIRDEIKKEIDGLIQNNPDYSSYLLFLSIKREQNDKYYFANLTKLFPIRSENYDAILEKVTHRTVAGFDYLLAWKMAALYGRVGVQNYPSKKTQEIAEAIAPALFESIRSRVKAKSFFEVPTTSDLGQIKGRISTLKGAKNEEARLKAEAALAKELQKYIPPPPA